MGNSSLRYLTVRKTNAPLVYGIQNIDLNKTVFVIEGPFDSMFVENSIAPGGTDFIKATNMIPKENAVLVFDNQPRNKEVCKLIEKNIDKGYQVVIWPQNLVEKDINEMVLAGRSVAKILKENTFKGLTAMTKYIAWKRC